ncbi:hypothetical protein WR25_08010 [Diploscapter pachys]|uniref:Peptidase M12B domain-containing protein n=1 Tax=Diploscapter pachys TaxID=2018661 RepID=A0A2A2JQE4_9BILA|nr:hypothetical protein WR25_08010 [Diploscapter pachys]
MRIEIAAILLTALHLGNSAKIHLRKKIKHGGVAFTKVHKYTNETLPVVNKALSTELALDIFMVADFSLYRGAVDMFKGDEVAGEHFTSLYLNAIFEQMRIIYEGIQIYEDGQNIRLSLAGTFITKREEDCPMMNSFEKEFDIERGNYTYEDDNTTLSFQAENSTEMSYTLNAHLAIDRVTAWVKKHADFLPKHDHAVFITKFDLLSVHGESATQGMAYVGNICSLGDSSSVVEDIGAANTAFIAAHELGHSLGSFHDLISKSGGCSSLDNFLMAASMSPEPSKIKNTRQFSECSKKAIAENLKSHKAYYSQPNCGRVWCKDRSKPINDNCETISYFPAFDGTECARNKWCIEMSCVENPKKMLFCNDINKKTCSRYSKAKLKHYCKNNDFFDICCRTCVLLKADKLI